MRFGFLDQVLWTGTLALLLVQGGCVVGFKRVSEPQSEGKIPVEQEFQRLVNSPFGWNWEIQHYHPKPHFDRTDVARYLRTIIQEMPKVEQANLPVHKTSDSKHKEQEAWFEWQRNVLHTLDLMRITPSQEYLPDLKYVVENISVSNSKFELTSMMIDNIRRDAVFTMGVCGANIKDLYELLNAKEDSVYAGALIAIGFQLSLLESSKPLNNFINTIGNQTRGIDNHYVQDAKIPKVGWISYIKQKLEETESLEEKVFLLLEEMYIDQSHGGAFFSSETYPSYYTVREFYKLYIPNRPKILKYIQKYLAKQKGINRQLTVKKLYLLGVPLTQNEKREINVGTNTSPNWIPLTLPGVPIYNPDDFKRK